jgi:ATP adenylyltransferase
MPIEFHNLFSINKKRYIKGKKNKDDCILCSIALHGGKISELLIADCRHSAVCVNKFPYNSGHLLIFPKRHLTDYRELSPVEESEIHKLLKDSLNILDSVYTPSGYNIGYNIGDFSGASISHLHMHVIPRYKNEMGFIDIVGGAKILIEDPVQTMKVLKKAFKKISVSEC